MGHIDMDQEFKNSGEARDAKLARIEKLKADSRAMMRGRCYECGRLVTTGNFIDSGRQRYCFPCAAKGADKE